jgi:biotin carboxyl carrier protein
MTDKQPMRTLLIEDRVYETRYTTKFERRRPYIPPDPGKLLCIIPGVIQKIHVTVGEKVSRDQPLLVIEAMKMQNDILSPLAGRIKAVHVKVGQMVPKGELLIEFE